MATEFLTPVGRLVQGDLYKPQTTNRKGEPLTIKTGPNKGQPTQQYYYALAIAKDNPELPAFYALLVQEARAGYPLFIDANGAATHPRFTFKMSDGDGVDADGKPNKDKEGFAGHFVFRFSGSYAPKIVHQGQLVMTENYIKRGSYVRIAGSAACNIGSDVPGLYLNAQAIELIGYGKEIVGGIDAVGAFAAKAAAYVPPGMSATPLAGSPSMPSMAAAALPPATPPAGITLPGVAPTPAVQPNHAFVANAIGAAPALPGMPSPPAAVGGMPPPAAAREPQPTEKAQGYPLSAWLAQGHSLDSLVAQGIFVR